MQLTLCTSIKDILTIHCYDIVTICISASLCSSLLTAFTFEELVLYDLLFHIILTIHSSAHAGAGYSKQ